MTGLKAAAVILLFLFCSLPVLVAAWWFFPLIVGLVLWLLWHFRDSKSAGRFLKPLALILAIAVTVWCYFAPWKRQITQPLESSRVNRYSYAAFGRPQTASAPAIDPELERFRSDALRHIENQRVFLKKIATALDLNSSADDYIARNSDGDYSSVGTARTNLQDIFTKGVDPVVGSLLNAGNLEDYKRKVTQELDRIQTTVQSPNASSEYLKKIDSDLSDQLRSFRIPELFDAVKKVEEALRQNFKTDLGAPSIVNKVKYDRPSDALIPRQEIIIDLGMHRAASIDLSGLVPRGLESSISLEVKPDNGDRVTARPPVFFVHLNGARTLTVTRSISQPNASYPAVASRLWVPFRAVSVRWPFPLSSSLKLGIALPDDPNDSWPYILDVKSAPTDALQSIELPPNSYFFSDDVVNPPTSIDKVVPTHEAPALVDLSSGKAIRIELMPPYLSWKLAQHFKTYLALDTILASLITALVTSGLIAFIGSRDPSAARR